MKLKKLAGKYGIWAVVALVALLFGGSSIFKQVSPEYTEISLYELESKVASGVAKDAKINSADHQIKIDLHDGKKFVANFPAEYDDDLMTLLKSNNVNGSAVNESFWDQYKGLFLIFGLLALLSFGSSAFFGIKKRLFVRNARVKETPKQRLTDVIGAEGLIRHVEQLIAYLKDPQKFTAAGVAAPRGWLIDGPPGNGKTLLCLAIAGEAGVEVSVLSGSDFAAKYYGESEAQIAALFKKAREIASKGDPIIIVIDEIDAVGGNRDDAGEARTATLNKLLTELDGFLKDELRVVVIGTTNRKDALDPALLRPGRLTKKLHMAAPDIRAREELFRMYAKKLTFLANDVNFPKLARRTMGLSGADIKEVCNTAGLFALRVTDDAPVTMALFEQAIAEHLVGHETSRIISEEERLTTAWHESGHALVGLLGDGNAFPEEVSIVARGNAGGVTHFSDDDRLFIDWPWINAMLERAMGSRAAERMMLGDKFTSGAGHDLEVATNILLQAITEYGMGDSVYHWVDHRHLADHPFAAEIIAEIQRRI
ncbi:MAG TPA: AAA family ATPase, partial [Candidatus Saccharimonadales bacterium]|nr:AAA family ATPase [Candidatus Saccharimonadales bacterium]